MNGVLGHMSLLGKMWTHDMNISTNHAPVAGLFARRCRDVRGIERKENYLMINRERRVRELRCGESLVVGKECIEGNEIV